MFHAPLVPAVVVEEEWPGTQPWAGARWLAWSALSLRKLNLELNLGNPLILRKDYI